MTTTKKTALLRRLGYVACAGLTVTAAGLLAPSQAEGAAANAQDGIVCEQDGSSTFDLDATSGYVNMPDGNSIFMWSYALHGQPFQFPGPTLCVKTGQTVTVTLHNVLPAPAGATTAPAEDTSIVFSGQGSVIANNVPAQPVLNGTQITSLTTPAAAGQAVTYSFTAAAPGTYLYSSGTDVRKQREMGLYGALVVHAADDGLVTTADGKVKISHVEADGAGKGTGYAYRTDQEYLHVLSSIDPAVHLAVETNKPFNYNTSVARYFLINGRSMPDTLAPNRAAWLPNQPYGGLLHISPTDPDPVKALAASQPQALLRYLNAGDVDFPFHPHGSSQRVVVRDGAPLQQSGDDASYEKFLVDVGPGQSVDALVSWGTENGDAPYKPNASTDPGKQIPSDIQLPAIQDQIIGPVDTWFSENPYLGQGVDGKTVNPITNGTTQNNQCGEYYQIAHSHALQQSTNYGASFGGMMTLIRIDPVGHPNCDGLL